MTDRKEDWRREDEVWRLQRAPKNEFTKVGKADLPDLFL